ncbi:MAG: hypothetical protein MZV64_43075 [Ignavibacteriales bacterium]|nr:hypothetical protein [Ignavibacteriales bacterium]
MSTVKRAHRRLEGRLYSHREDAGERRDPAAPAVSSRRSGCGARGAALLRVPRRPPRVVRGRGRSAGPAAARLRLRHRRSPSRPRLLRAARRAARRRGGRVPRLRPQPASLSRLGHRRLRIPAA